MYAVLTADLVQSRQMNAEQHDSVLYQLEQLLRSGSDPEQCRYNFYRGDAFQILLLQPAAAIQICLAVRLTLLSLGHDCKISIGIGAVSNLRADVKSASGPAFTLSGTGLDQMPAGQKLSFHSQISPLEYILQVPLQLLDTMLSAVTARQAEALLLFLLAPAASHEDIASKMGTSRANVTKLLNNTHLNYQLLQQFQHYCQQHITEQVARHLQGQSA